MTLAKPFATVRTQSLRTIRDGPNPNPNPIIANHSRMVHNDWVWIWVQTVTNGFAGAVMNGLQRLGLGLGSDRREWLSTTVWE